MCVCVCVCVCVYVCSIVFELYLNCPAHHSHPAGHHTHASKSAGGVHGAAGLLPSIAERYNNHVCELVSLAKSDVVSPFFQRRFQLMTRRSPSRI